MMKLAKQPESGTVDSVLNSCLLTAVLLGALLMSFPYFGLEAPSVISFSLRAEVV
jgi:hypothetical protein